MDRHSWSSFGRKSFRDFHLIPDGSILRGSFSSTEIPQVFLWCVAVVALGGFGLAAVYGNLGVPLSIGLALLGFFAASTILERSSLWLDLDECTLVVVTRSPLKFTNRRCNFRFFEFDLLLAVALVSHEENSLIWYLRRHSRASYQKVASFSFEPSEEANVLRMIAMVADEARWKHRFVNLTSMGFLAFKLKGLLPAEDEEKTMGQGPNTR